MTTDQPPVTPLTKRRVVLDLVTAAEYPQPGGSALYARPDDDAPEGTIGLPIIYLTREDFLALGEREQVTITIEPGNTLPTHRTPCIDGNVCGDRAHCPPPEAPEATR